MFVTNWISTTKIQKISEITNFFRHDFLSRTEVDLVSGARIGNQFGNYRRDLFRADLRYVFSRMGKDVPDFRSGNDGK